MKSTEMTFGCFWSSRSERASECAHKVFSFIKQIESYPGCSAWYFKVWNEKNINRAISFNMYSLEEMALYIEKSINRDDTVFHNPIPSLGYRINLFNDDNYLESKLSISVGIYSDNLLNRIILKISENNPILTDLQQSVAMLNTMVDCWNPDWAGLYTREAVEKKHLNKIGPENPFLGKILYLNPSVYSRKRVKVLRTIDHLKINRKIYYILDSNLLGPLKENDPLYKAIWAIPRKKSYTSHFW